MLCGTVAAGLGSLSGLAFGAALIEFLPVHAQDVPKTTPDVILDAVLIAVMILLPVTPPGCCAGSRRCVCPTADPCVTRIVIRCAGCGRA